MLGDADAGVGDREAEVGQVRAGGRRRRGERDLPDGGELDRVGQQVDQDLPQPAAVADHPLGHLRRDVRTSARPFAVAATDAMSIAAWMHWRTFNGARSTRTAPASIFEKSSTSPSEVEQVLAAGADTSAYSLWAVERRALQQRRHPDDRVQRRADLVAHVGHELALGARRRGQLAVDLLQAPRRLLAQPRERQRAGDPRDQLARGERLDQVVVGAGVDALDGGLLARARGQHDHRDRARALVRAQRREQPETVQARHHHVGQHEVRRVGERGFERGLAVGHGVHLEAGGEHARDVPAHVLVVVGEQHARARASRRRSRAPSSVPSHCRASSTSASAPRVNAGGRASPSCSAAGARAPRGP